MDSEGNTLEFLLSPTRDAEAAKRFAPQSALLLCSFGTSRWAKVPQLALPANGNASGQAPRVINVDKNAAYPKAIAELKSSKILPASVELTSASNT